MSHSGIAPLADAVPVSALPPEVAHVKSELLADAVPMTQAAAVMLPTFPPSLQISQLQASTAPTLAAALQLGQLQQLTGSIYAATTAQSQPPMPAPKPAAPAASDSADKDTHDKAELRRTRR